MAVPRARADLWHDIHNKRFAADAWVDIASGTKTGVEMPPEFQASRSVITSTGDPRADAQLAFACALSLFSCLFELALVELADFRESYELRRRR